MLALLKKEISSFFSSVSGYIVIIIFLVINGLTIWVFPGVLNILDAGYASLNSYFTIAPWVFLFLIPAITMRMIAEEKRLGTIEFIFTKPISDLNIIFAKYLATIVLVAMALIPSLIYFLTIYMLGNPVGNMDTGGAWGSFIGLFLLAGIYGSIGIFSSSLTDNQIIAFIWAVSLCFLLYIGFDAIGSLGIFQENQYFIALLGINEHYQSMSRGVIDSRDLIYFLSVIALFIALAQFNIKYKRK